MSDDKELKFIEFSKSKTDEYHYVDRFDDIEKLVLYKGDICLTLTSKEAKRLYRFLKPH